MNETRGDLFAIFGQPDVDIRRVGEGQLQVEIRGVDAAEGKPCMARWASSRGL